MIYVLQSFFPWIVLDQFIDIYMFMIALDKFGTLGSYMWLLIVFDICNIWVINFIIVDRYMVLWFDLCNGIESV